jgi:hypothetical protein
VIVWMVSKLGNCCFAVRTMGVAEGEVVMQWALFLARLSEC